MHLTNEDEEFLNSFGAGGTTTEQVTTDPVVETGSETGTVTPLDETPVGDAPTGETVETAENLTTEPTVETPETGPEVVGDTGSAGDGSVVEAPTSTNAELDAFRAQVLAPFKAAGKEITPQSIEELQQLAKMGVDYTRKMQQLASGRKYTTMLERAGLLDEDKLAFAIDLVVGKNPQAIAKFLKDSGVDPLDIDTRSEPQYVAGNHKVSDQEIQVRSTIEEIASRDGGQEVIDMITSTWDNQSQINVVNDPNGLEVVYQHKQSGVYDRVAAHVERQRLMNQIPVNVPFVNAYVAAFQQLEAAGQLADLQPATSTGVHNAETQSAQVRVPVATKVATPTPKVTNGAKASAASVSQPTRRPVNTNVDLAQLGDDEFLKAMNQSLKV